ncbi:hypothetical protein D3C87_1541270 [compost metagenome]
MVRAEYRVPGTAQAGRPAARRHRIPTSRATVSAPITLSPGSMARYQLAVASPRASSAPGKRFGVLSGGIFSAMVDIPPQYLLARRL